MAIAVDAVSTPTPGNTTWNHTVGSGDNRLLVVGVACHTQDTPSAPTAGGSAMTLLGSQSGNYRKALLYYLVNPPSGTVEIVVSKSGAWDYVPAPAAISFTGVDQDTPLGSGAGATGNSTPATVDVSSASGDLVIDVVAAFGWNTLTVGAGQTERWNYAVGNYNHCHGASSTEPGAATVTMSWTIANIGGDDNWSIYAASIKAAVIPPTEVACEPLIGAGVLSVRAVYMGYYAAMEALEAAGSLGATLKIDLKTAALESIGALGAIPEFGLKVEPFAVVGALGVPGIFYGIMVPVQPLGAIGTLGAVPTLQIATTPFAGDGSIDADLKVGLLAAPLALTSQLATGSPWQFVLLNPVLLYFCTLTGSADGKADLTLPISSFQCRLRSGDPTYLSVVVPGVAYADAIADRSNGDLVIHMAKTKAGVIYHSEEIARVALENVRLDEGGKSQSVTLDGHKTVTFSAKSVTLEGAEYRMTYNGKTTLRCPVPDIYLRPGDTVVYDGESFVVGLISYSISIDDQWMEVTEA